MDIQLTKQQWWGRPGKKKRLPKGTKLTVDGITGKRMVDDGDAIEISPEWEGMQKMLEGKDELE